MDSRRKSTKSERGNIDENPSVETNEEPDSKYVRKTSLKSKSDLEDKRINSKKKKSQDLTGENVLSEPAQELEDEGEELFSEESYDSFDSQEQPIRKHRKKYYPDEEEGEYTEEPIEYIEEEEEEEEEEEIPIRQRTETLRDVSIEGYLTLTELREMSLSQIQAALDEIGDEIELIQVENLVYERTVLKMEKREIEIEASLPPFTYKFPWEIEGEAKGIEVKALHPNATCGELSDDEPDPPDGVYRSYIPAEDPDLDHEAVAKMLLGQDAEAETSDLTKTISVTEYLKSLGEIPPKNFDVIKHKYGDLVRFAKYQYQDIPKGKKGKFVDPFKSLLKKQDKEKGESSDNEIEDEEKDLESDPVFGSMVTLIQDYEPDPEFPGFDPGDAKKLPITEKIKYAEIEEESLRLEFHKRENDGIQEENAIQVYIDTYSDSYNLSIRMSEEFKQVIADAKHHLTGKIRAEKIRAFREKLKKKLLGLEAKMSIRFIENDKKRRRLTKQLKVAQDVGGGIQLVDFEHLRVQNMEYQGHIDELVDQTKKLKLITTEWFTLLTRSKDKLMKSLDKRKILDADIAIRESIIANFDTQINKSLRMADTIKSHCTYMKKRMRRFAAPSTLDYINKKSLEHRLLEELELLRSKAKVMSASLSRARVPYKKLMTIVPDKESIRDSTERWFKEIRKEVEDNHLMERCMDTSKEDSLMELVDYRTSGKDTEYSTKEFPSYTLQNESNQSSMFLTGMTQSVIEFYAVGKEQKKLERLREIADGKKRMRMGGNSTSF